MKQELKAVSIMLRATHALEEILKKDIESYGINTTEFGVLEYLYAKGKQPIKFIGQKLLMANSSMTYVIDKLHQKEYVKRISDSKDRRLIYIDLTTQGRAFFESIFPNHKNTLKDIYAILSDQELNQMLDLLKKVGYHCDHLLLKGKL